MKETAVTGLDQVLSKWPQAGFTGSIWGCKLSSLNSLNYPFLLHKRSCPLQSPSEGSWWELWEAQDGEGVPSKCPVDTFAKIKTSAFHPSAFFFPAEENKPPCSQAVQFGIIQSFCSQNNIWSVFSRLWKKKLLLNADAISLCRRQLLQIHQKSSQD